MPERLIFQARARAWVEEGVDRDAEFFLLALVPAGAVGTWAGTREKIRGSFSLGHGDPWCVYRIFCFGSSPPPPTPSLLSANVGDMVNEHGAPR